MGRLLKESFDKVVDRASPILLDTVLGHYRERYKKVGMYEHRVYPGIQQMLSQLYEMRYRLFVATSKPEVFATQILHHFGLAGYFEKIYGAELDGTRSEKSDLIKYILETNSIKEPSLMVGDRKFDVIGALNNGIDALGVTYGYGSKEELTEAGAHHLCQSPDELYRWIAHEKKL